ncbi:hypothetical protein NZD88_01685 [Chryseobacterium antibioticum]|uniref:Uncharacterized protein n=1 Tax=Chryseobacterium pyrolae TaxID=2987481 RepID=A0ABT2ICB9_9FLAO|nr:hypothetical protein [Chryseobacterium pyrolae]MCT2406264.1 hypothetical protein [Chryseobacterium pyrolae]
MKISIKGKNVAEIVKNITFEQQQIKMNNGHEFISKLIEKVGSGNKLEFNFLRLAIPADPSF